MWRRSLTDAFQITAAQAGTFRGASLMKPPRGEGVEDPSSTYTASIGQYGPCNPIRPSETLSRFRLSEREIIKLGGAGCRAPGEAGASATVSDPGSARSLATSCREKRPEN